MDRRLDDFHHGRPLSGGKYLKVMGPSQYLQYLIEPNVMEIVFRLFSLLFATLLFATLPTSSRKESQRTGKKVELEKDQLGHKMTRIIFYVYLSYKLNLQLYEAG